MTRGPTGPLPERRTGPPPPRGRGRRECPRLPAALRCPPGAPGRAQGDGKSDKGWKDEKMLGNFGNIIICDRNMMGR